MRKEFFVGSYDVEGKGRKGNRFYIEAELKENEKGQVVFSVCGYSTYSNGKGYMMCGQCLDTMYKYAKVNPTFKKLYRLWKLYHLNSFKAGLPCQEKAVKEYTKNNPYDYTKVCEYLKAKDLLVVDGYRYGSSWIYEPIPQEDLEKIKELLAD